jgi:hypothetical protein
MLTSAPAGSPISRALCLQYVMRDPIAFREYWTKKATKRPFTWRYYMSPVTMAAAQGDTALYAGRGSGKSLSVLEPELVRHAINRPGEETLLTSFRKTHIRERMERAIDYILQIKFFSVFFYQRIVRSPIYEVRLSNGHVLYGVSVGEDAEAKQAQGKHASLIALEEAQQYAERPYMKINGGRDPRGSRTLMIGVPDGRVETPFRLADTEYDSFIGRRFHVSRQLDPYWDRTELGRAIEQYGSTDSDLFGQEVNAEWGNPAWSAWNIDHLYAAVDEKALPLEPIGDNPWYVPIVEISGRAYRERQLTPESACRGLGMRKWMEGRVLIAADIGYTQPTAILVFQQAPSGVWALIARLSLTNRMEHDDQAAIFDWLGVRFSASQIAIDTTDGEGRAIARELEQMPRWSSRLADEAVVSPIVRVMFNENAVYDYARNDETGVYEPVTDGVKHISVRVLRALLARRGLLIPRDEDMISEFNQERETRTRDGMVTIRTPPTVHIPEAMRVFATLLFRESPPVMPHLPEEESDVFAPAFGEISWGGDVDADADSTAAIWG